MSTDAIPASSAVDVGGADAELVRTLLTRMLVVRGFEETLTELKRTGEVFGALHLCNGQEAVGVGATSVLEPTDTATSTHRGHAHYIGKGADVGRLFAEILGREAGYGHGRAGHMLIAASEVGLLGGTGIVGGMVPVAVGQALAFATRREPRVALTFFGDGAANEGVVAEALNGAALWRLPVVFVCENNGFGLTVPTPRQSAAPIAPRATAFGVPAEQVDGNDVLAVRAAVATAVERARSGGGPGFVEARTYRMAGFATSDQGGYQTAEELEGWRARDPIERLAAGALAAGLLTEDEVAQARADASATLSSALEWARACELPAPEVARQDVWSLAS